MRQLRQKNNTLRKKACLPIYTFFYPRLHSKGASAWLSAFLCQACDKWIFRTGGTVHVPSRNPMTLIFVSFTDTDSDASPKEVADTENVAPFRPGFHWLVAAVLSLFVVNVRRTCHFDVFAARLVCSITPLRANHTIADDVPALVSELVVHLTAIDDAVAAPLTWNALDYGEPRRLALVLVEGAAEDAFTLKEALLTQPGSAVRKEDILTCKLACDSST